MLSKSTCRLVIPLHRRLRLQTVHHQLRRECSDSFNTRFLCRRRATRYPRNIGSPPMDSFPLDMRLLRVGSIWGSIFRPPQVLRFTQLLMVGSSPTTLAQAFPNRLASSFSNPEPMCRTSTDISIAQRRKTKL